VQIVPSSGHDRRRSLFCWDSSAVHLHREGASEEPTSRLASDKTHEGIPPGVRREATVGPHLIRVRGRAFP